MFEELQLGTGFVSRQYHYHAGEVTDEHRNAEKLKSSPTTQLVSQIVLSGGRTLSYEYDAEERITKVTDSAEGTTEYTYDAWGACIILQDSSNCHIATINPYRYRGYYYDYEIGMYYLQSRYFDSTIASFINSDNPLVFFITHNSFDINLFCYCGNNPIGYKDPYGHCYQIETIMVGGDRTG